MKYGTNTVSECPINMLSEFSLPDTLSSPLSIFCTYEMHKYTELLKYCSKIDENLTMNKHVLFCSMIALTCSRCVVGEKRFYEFLPELCTKLNRRNCVHTTVVELQP